MMRMREALGLYADEYRAWWHEQPAGKWGDPTELLPYLTPEQQADFTEFGGFVFESGLGRPMPWHISNPAPQACLRATTPLTRTQWMVAVKLVYQAAYNEISLVAGYNGAHLP